MAWRSPCATTPSDAALDAVLAKLAATRPDRRQSALGAGRDGPRHRARSPRPQRADAAFAKAAAICDEDVDTNRRIGEHGADAHRASMPSASAARRSTCSPIAMPAGWRRVDWGTALSPIYQAHDAGLPVHVWVDETRPRNQGAALTAYELGAHGVPHTIIADNAGGHLMQHGAGRSVHRRHRPRGGQWRCGEQDRHLSEGARRARTTTCRSTSRCPIRPSTGRWPTGARHPDRGARRGRGDAHDGPHRRGRGRHGRISPRPAAPPPIRPST